MKRLKFPTLPCLVVTMIVAVLLAIGLAWPFAAEAFPDKFFEKFGIGGDPEGRVPDLGLHLRPGETAAQAGGYVMKESMGAIWPTGGGERPAKIAGLKMGGGVLSPKPPRSDDETGPVKGPVPKPKAKIVRLGIDTLPS